MLTQISLIVILFFIMDPVGNIPSMLTLMKNVPEKRRRWVIVREMLIALFVMFVFNFIGEGIFYLLDISETTVRLSSGIILFLFSVTILFPSLSNPRMKLPKGEPFVIPLAIPLTAGPALLATIMLFAHLEPGVMSMVIAIIVAWTFGLVIMLLGRPLNRLLGDNGLMALERLMAMILVLIAIQRFMEGVKLFLNTY